MRAPGKDSQINPMDAKEDTRSLTKGNRIQEADALLQTDPEALRCGRRKKQHGAEMLHGETLDVEQYGGDSHLGEASPSHYLPSSIY